MPSPKDIKNLLKATQGTKAAGKALDLEELLGRLPKGTAQQQLEAELMFKRLQEEQAARYAPTNPPTERGNAALREAQSQLRERGKQKFLEPSAEKRRMYHGTRHYKPGITTFDPENRPSGEGISEFQTGRRGMTFVSPDERFANMYAGDARDADFMSGAVYPVHVQARNPFDFENADHLDIMTEELAKLSGDSPDTPAFIHAGPEKIRAALRRGTWDIIESPPVIEAAKRLGFDSMYMNEQGIKNLGVFDPKRIKSAIGNQGTYDITNPDITKAEGGVVHMAGGGPLGFMKTIQKLSKEMRAAEKAGDIETALATRESLNDMIRLGVNDPMMPRAKPLTQAELAAYAERMAPQVAGELTRGKKGARTMAGKTQQQFKREKTLPVNRTVMPGETDPMAQLPLMTLEGQKGSVLLGLPGDQTLARMNLHGIGDVDFEIPVGLHGGPRYGDDEKLWASNLGAATGLLSAADRASMQYGNAPVIASYMKMPSGLPFAQHYLESLLQYQRPNELSKSAHNALVKDIRKGFINAQGKRVTFPDFPGFGDLGEVAQMAEADSGLRKHIADRLEKGKKYGLRPAGDVQFAVSHPELTNLETGASGFTLGELSPQQTLGPSSHPTYSHDIAGKVLGQTEYPIPYDLLYRDQLNLIRQNPYSPEFNTLKLLGARQPIDEQLVNEINEYQERMRKLLGRKDGGDVNKEDNAPEVDVEQMLNEHVNAFKDPATGVSGLIAGKSFSPLEGVDMRGMASLIRGAEPKDIKSLALTIELAKRMGVKLDDKGLSQVYGKLTDDGGLRLGYSPKDKSAHLSYWAPFAEGGPVHMAGGNEPGESIGEMFKPKPFTIPQPLTDLADAIKAQYEKERRSMRKPGALTDVLLRGPAAFTMGAPMDIAGMGGEALDWLQTKIPGLRKKASVMDTGPQDHMPYGSAHAQELMNKAGLTTGEERPLLELGTAIVAPGAASKALKYGKAGAKVLAPTTMDIMETQLQRATAPMRMSIVPEGGPSGKLKAPANDLGFYNPVEKAALNVQRKKGQGSAFVSDLKKTPGVNDERLAELGLGDLASRPNVTREEVLAATEQNRIPLRETVLKEGNQNSELLLEKLSDDIYQLKDDMSYMDNDSREWAEADRTLTRLQKEYEAASQAESQAKRAMFGPTDAPNYNMPGGENYREIRVALPSNRPSIKNMSRNEYNAAIEKADREGVENFMHTTHHGDEPNVLFHLRVADHVDAEGKKGLLIDELQSDWHQQGREKGYKTPEVETRRKELEKLAWPYMEQNRPIPAELRAEIDALPPIMGSSSKVPNAPFKDNWYQLGLKRAIKEAADTGVDRVYLTTGARQADRYDLSKQISKIEYDEMGNLRAYDKNGAQVIAEPVPKDKLADYVGKDMAKKIVENSEKRNNARLKYRELLKSDAPNDVVDVAYKEYLSHPTEYSGLDLKVGGEGMRQYYDKTYLNFLKKYAKQFGATVGETTLPAASKKMNQLSSQEIEAITKTPGWFDDFMKLSGHRGPLMLSDEQYSSIFNKLLPKYAPQHGEKVYYIDVTPKMRESAAKGQSYKDGGAVKMAEGGAVDYEAKFNKMLQDHVAGMAEGGAVDYESRFNDMLQKHVQDMAEGGEVENSYNNDPDMADGGRFIQAPAFADGGAVKSIWTVN
jgi:hypothetical protein